MIHVNTPYCPQCKQRATVEAIGYSIVEVAFECTDCEVEIFVERNIATEHFVSELKKISA